MPRPAGEDPLVPGFRDLEPRDPFDRFRNTAADQDLAVLRFGTKPGGEVADRANRGVAGAFRKTDLTQGRETLRDAHTKTKFAPVTAPSRDQFTGRLAHRDGHFYGALGGVGARHRSLKNTM